MKSIAPRQRAESSVFEPIPMVAGVSERIGGLAILQANQAANS